MRFSLMFKYKVSLEIFEQNISLLDDQICKHSNYGISDFGGKSVNCISLFVGAKIKGGSESSGIVQYTPCANGYVGWYCYAY